MHDDLRNTPNQSETLCAIDQIKQRYDAAMPVPDAAHVQNQLSLHLGEMSGILKMMGSAGQDFRSKEQLTFAHDVLGYLQRQFSSSSITVDVERLDHPDLTEYLCYLIASAVGLAHVLRLDISRALDGLASKSIEELEDGSRPTPAGVDGLAQVPKMRAVSFAPFTPLADKGPDYGSP
jgi:hypothetical protein